MASLGDLSHSKLERRSQIIQPHILIGVTSAQTCMILSGRLKALRESGFRVTLLSGPGSLFNEICQNEGVDAVCIPMRRNIALAEDAVAWWRIFQTLRRLKPDIVEFSTPKAGFLGLTAAFIAGIKHRVYLLRGLKLERSRGFKRRILLAAERCAAASAHFVLCNSFSLRCEAEDLEIAHSKKLKVIGAGSSRGVDIVHFSPGKSDIRAQYGIPENAPVLGFVGRLTRDKGLPELLVAFDAVLKKHPAAMLMLVGWFDSSEDALDSIVRERIEMHPRIIYTDFIVDPAPYYRAMDIFVLPTWREGFPNAVLEAAATGIPAITTLSTGARDAVVPEVTGLLVPPGYPEAISEAAIHLLNSPFERERMGVAARAWVQENFVDRHILKLTVDFYRSLYSGKRPHVAATQRQVMDSASPSQ